MDAIRIANAQDLIDAYLKAISTGQPVEVVYAYERSGDNEDAAELFAEKTAREQLEGEGGVEAASAVARALSGKRPK